MVVLMAPSPDPGEILQEFQVRENCVSSLLPPPEGSSIILLSVEWNSIQFNSLILLGSDRELDSFIRILSLC